MRVLKPNDILSRSTQLLSTELDQETVLMSIDGGAYASKDQPEAFGKNSRIP